MALKTGMADDNREFIYRVDAKDRIVFANAAWYDFATENGAAILLPEAVVGVSLWSFVCNAETKQLFAVLLKKVRDSGHSVTLPYRCDGPDCRRFMELKISRETSEEIEFRSRIVRLELRPWVRLLQDQVERNDKLLSMCGWCKKVALRKDHWVEVEEAVNVLQLFDAARLPQITHGICPKCSNAFRERVDQLA